MPNLRKAGLTEMEDSIEDSGRNTRPSRHNPTAGMVPKGVRVNAFEASSLLLLATMIAVILLAKRQRGPAGADRREPAGYPWQKGVEQ